MVTGRTATRRVRVDVQRWPIAGGFATARGRTAEAAVVLVEVREGEHVGRGEAAPISRYGEAPDKVRSTIEALQPEIEAGLAADAVRGRVRPGAARNALECALLDLEAKRSGVPVHTRLRLPGPHPLVTAYTVSVDTPARMAAQARREAWRPLLKLKLGGAGDEARLAACREAAPEAVLIADANESWTPELLPALAEACAAARVALVEQPLPAGDDDALEGWQAPVPIFADESCHGLRELAALASRYDGVNVKLDKTGGLLEGIAVVREARALGLGVMVGCMVGTSLAMAPAVLLGQLADHVDLDGPLLLERDRVPALHYQGSTVSPPDPELWG